MWNNSYRTPTERWQKTSDLPKGNKLPTYLGRAKEIRKNRDKELGQHLHLWKGAVKEERFPHTRNPLRGRRLWVAEGGSFGATEESAATGVRRAKQRDSCMEDWRRAALTSPRGLSAQPPGRAGLGAEARALVGSQGEDWGWRREHSLKGASAPQLAGRESGKKSAAAEEARDFFLPLCFLVHEERGFRAQPKRAPETGTSRGDQRGPQRRAWDAKPAAAATKKPVCEHRSPSTPPLLGACAARHCQGPVIQGQLPRENALRASGWCNVTLASAAAGSPRLLRTPPSPQSEWARAPESTAPLTPSSLSEEQTPSGDLHAEVGPNPKLNPGSCANREREISPSSLRSSGFNLHNQLDVPCISGVPE